MTSRIGHGLYAIGSRAQAKVFRRFTQANAAIQKTNAVLRDLGLSYHVEQTDDPVLIIREDRYFNDPPG